jgi:hypothetical protein
LSAQAYEEFLHLQASLEQMQYDENSADAWTMIWGDRYSSCRFYAHAFCGVEAHPYYKVPRNRIVPRGLNSLLG